MEAEVFYSKYTRTFTINVAHFNDANPYPLFWSHYLDNQPLTQAEWMLLLSSVHGHDFKIKVSISGEISEGKPYLIADEDLELIVKQWHNQNLSVHPDFADKRIRATTEYMAKFLMEKILDEVKGAGVEVEIFEGDQISASCDSW